MTPVTVIEFGCVAAPALAPLHTVALKLTPCPGCAVCPPTLFNVIVSLGGCTVGTGVGVAVTVTPGVGVTVMPGVGVGSALTVTLTNPLLLAVLLSFGSLT